MLDHNKDMGKIAHVSKSTINRLENGSSTPTDDIIKAYSEFFNVSTDYLKPIKPSTNTIPTNAVPVAELGITEDVIATYKKIDELSNSNENIRAVLNALIGNNLETVILLQSILSYLANQENGSSTRETENIFIENVLKYVNNIMKPQLQKVLKKNITWQDSLMDNNFYEK